MYLGKVTIIPKKSKYFLKIVLMFATIITNLICLFSTVTFFCFEFFFSEISLTQNLGFNVLYLHYFPWLRIQRMLLSMSEPEISQFHKAQPYNALQ